MDAGEYFVHLAVVLVPMFVGGSFLVGVAGEYLPPERVERTLRRYDEGVGNVAAAGFGAVTPFCSCSTVPALAGLLQAGAPLGLAFSFLLASPLVNEIAVLLLLVTFGPTTTAIYVAATFTAAVVGGIVIGRLGMADHVKNVEQLTGDGDAAAADGGTRGCASTATAGTDSCTLGGGPATDGGTVDCNTHGGADSGSGRGSAGTAAPEGRGHRERVGAAAGAAWSFFGETLPYLLVGMTIGALIHGVVPTWMIRGVLGPSNPLAVPLAALAGAPVYVSMSGMLPIAASLHNSGVAIGTVVAFVIGGAGVSLPNLVLLGKLFERRLLAVYAATVVTIGTVVGALFNAVLV